MKVEEGCSGENVAVNSKTLSIPAETVCKTKMLRCLVSWSMLMVHWLLRSRTSSEHLELRPGF